MTKQKHKFSHSKLRFRMLLLVLTIFYWNVVIRLAIFLRMLGAASGDVREVLSKGMEFVVNEIFLSSIIISAFAALSWFIMNFVYYRLARTLQLRRLMIGVVVFDVAVFVFIGLLLGLVHYNVDKGIAIADTLPKLKGFLFNSTTLFFLVILFVGSYVYQLLITLFYQLGHATIGKVIIGYYQKPREVNRIFMFLDLQSSTAFAEKLGHERYSDFIQDCFRYLSSPLLSATGRVYQYVGDEVVVTWNASKPKNFKRAVDFYYLFQKELQRHKNYFEKKYGLQPVFTASINSGRVMAAEVGEIKKELAFHGDVLNTAARIQKQCKRYRKQILVTRNFAGKLAKEKTGYKLNYIDFIKFQGKDRTVKIYEVYLPE